jgi:hypothetical protein
MKETLHIYGDRHALRYAGNSRDALNNADVPGFEYYCIGRAG